MICGISKIINKKDRIILTILILLFLPLNIFAEIWDYSCERSIKNLKDSQEEISNAYDELISAESEVKSAKSSYNVCISSNRYGCEYERKQLINAVNEYNDHRDELKAALSEFDYYVRKFNIDCISRVYLPPELYLSE